MPNIEIKDPAFLETGIFLTITVLSVDRLTLKVATLDKNITCNRLLTSEAKL